MLSASGCRELSDVEMLSEFLPSTFRVDDWSESRIRESAASAVERVRRGFQNRPIARSLAQIDEIAATMIKRFPRERLAIIRRADRATQGSFDIFGRHDIDFGHPVNWRLEPLAGKEAPLVHWSRIDYLDRSVAGDKKITWELNRHSHFIALGQAYAMTRDEAYAVAFVEQASSWMDQNPPNMGINWSSSLELALRSIAWIWAISLFANSPVISVSFLKRVVKCLIAHARHIEMHMSTYFSPNTHLTGEALGLLHLGIALPQCRRALAWKRKGLAVLLDQLSRQVRDEGVYFEPSSYYHRYTVDFYLSLVQLARENSIELPPGVDSRLESMIDYLMWITRPDGFPTLIGDDDGGKLLMLGARDGYDFRDSLALGAALLGRPRWKYSAGQDTSELLWLLGPSGLARFDRLRSERPDELERAFTTTGQYVVRDGWECDSTYFFFRCGPAGALSGAHDHADQLSFEIFANGTAWLVDPGTYTYTSDESARNEFRLARAHNTLAVDEFQQSVPSGPFSWRSRASGTPDPLVSNHRFTCMGGSHNGYLALAQPVRHQRSVFVFRRDHRTNPAMPGYVLVTDYVEADSEHTYHLSYHFGPHVAAASSGPEFTACDPLGNVLYMVQFGTVDISTGTTTGRLSTRYSQQEESTIGWVEAVGSGPQMFSSVIFPDSLETWGRVSISRLTRDGSISVRRDEVQDLLIFGDGLVSADGLAIRSSARMAWIRRTGARILSAAVVDGNSLTVDGFLRLASSGKPKYMLADLTDHRLSVYTDDPGSIVLCDPGPRDLDSRHNLVSPPSLPIVHMMTR